jgi:hypothetical protein
MLPVIRNISYFNDVLQGSNYEKHVTKKPPLRVAIGYQRKM